MRLPALFSSPALVPTALSEVTERAVHEMLREGESRNTQASYRGALRYWAAWFGLRYGLQIALPLAAPAVLQFIVDHVERSTPKGLAPARAGADARDHELAHPHRQPGADRRRSNPTQNPSR